MGSELEIWVVTEKPEDFPDKFVARKFFNDKPTTSCIVANSLESLREGILFVNPNLVCLQRHSSDDPVIVETWL